MHASLPIGFKYGTHTDSFGNKTQCVQMRWWKFFYHRYVYRAAVRLYYHLGAHHIFRWNHR